MPYQDQPTLHNTWSNARNVFIILILTLVVGAFTLGLSINAASEQRSAQKQDVEANKILLERVQMLEEINNKEVKDHRVRNEELHADICRIIYEIVLVAPSLKDKGIQPCNAPIHIEETGNEGKDSSNG